MADYEQTESSVRNTVPTVDGCAKYANDYARQLDSFPYMNAIHFCIFARRNGCRDNSIDLYLL